jgi:hypothetical protein
VLVCSEQGLGDQIMFASCLGDLCEDADCIVECDPRLVPIFARSFAQARVYGQRKRSAEPWREDGLTPAAKTWIGSLPLRYRSRPSDFPGTPYLYPDPAKVAAWSLRLRSLGAGLKVGISWRGGTATTRRALRSIDLDVWLPILREPDVHAISLQYGDCHGEIERTERTYSVAIHHWPEALSDYDQTAALVSALDIVVTVQTSIVHLAGALGKPVWVLVPRVAEWRYGEAGERLPWYASARIWRQNQERWDGLIERVSQELRELSGGIPPERT